jgi:hypothetical protein
VEDFYSYQQEESEDGSYTYTFITNQRLVYAIEFSVSEYSDYLDSFPTLLENGYSFSIFQFPVEVGIQEKRKFDPKVSNTVFVIVSKHFEVAGPESVLLFFCDTLNNLQRCRHILFNRWYNESYLNKDFVKQSLAVEIIQEPPINHYIGYLAMKNNSSLPLIQDEFDSFSYFMIGSKSNSSE